MSTKSLWGKLPLADAVKTPLTIMREQAMLLGEITGNLLKASVDGIQIDKVTGLILAYLEISVPILDDYTITIAVLSYKLGVVYPVELKNAITKETVRCEDESTFIEEFEKVLTSPEVRDVMGSVIAQVQTMGNKSTTILGEE